MVSRKDENSGDWCVFFTVTGQTKGQAIKKKKLLLAFLDALGYKRNYHSVMVESD